jgi:hypothetical protein
MKGSTSRDSVATSFHDDKKPKRPFINFSWEVQRAPLFAAFDFKKKKKFAAFSSKSGSVRHVFKKKK